MSQGVKDLTILGSLQGSGGQLSGGILVSSYVPNSIKIHGDLIGGSGNRSGSIRMEGFVGNNPIGDVWVGGSVEEVPDRIPAQSVWKVR